MSGQLDEMLVRLTATDRHVDVMFVLWLIAAMVADGWPQWVFLAIACLYLVAGVITGYALNKVRQAVKR